jgi:hypothetical protein
MPPCATISSTIISALSMLCMIYPMSDHVQPVSVTYIQLLLRAW